MRGEIGLVGHTSITFTRDLFTLHLFQTMEVINRIIKCQSAPKLKRELERLKLRGDEETVEDEGGLSAGHKQRQESHEVRHCVLS